MFIPMQKTTDTNELFIDWNIDSIMRLVFNFLILFFGLLKSCIKHEVFVLQLRFYVINF